MVSSHAGFSPSSDSSSCIKYVQRNPAYGARPPLVLGHTHSGASRLPCDSPPFQAWAHALVSARLVTLFGAPSGYVHHTGSLVLPTRGSQSLISAGAHHREGRARSGNVCPTSAQTPSLRVFWVSGQGGGAVRCLPGPVPPPGTGSPCSPPGLSGPSGGKDGPHCEPGGFLFSRAPRGSPTRVRAQGRRTVSPLRRVCLVQAGLLGFHLL